MVRTKTKSINHPDTPLAAAGQSTLSGKADLGGGFDRGRRELVMECSLPPTDNQLARSTATGRRYPAPAYLEWLEREHRRLREVLGEWEPDRAGWWQVALRLHLGSPPGDGQNRLKAVLDMLSGRRVVSRRVEDGPGLWRDDARVTTMVTVVATLHDPEPRVVIIAGPAPAPESFRGLRRGQRRGYVGTLVDPERGW